MLDRGKLAVKSNYDEIMGRVALGEVAMTDLQEKEYLATPDNIGQVVKGTEPPLGYKRCGACGDGKKFYLFNKNSGSKTNTSGNCKACQKVTAGASYTKTKKNRNYKKYYAENKEAKQQHARKYYDANKDIIKDRHKAYLQTPKGKKVMLNAHSKRRKSLSTNKGVPYTRFMVIDRDGKFVGREYPLCYLCQQDITDISGAGLHIDHVVPVVESGLDCFTNVASSHTQCNLRREKDARQLTLEQVDAIIEQSEAYIDAHTEQFGE